MGLTWTAVRGAARFVAALALGDVADPSRAETRASSCRECPLREDRTVTGTPVSVSFCGRPFVEAPGTCGCLVLFAGRPAGKIMVRSEACPSGRWSV